MARSHRFIIGVSKGRFYIRRGKTTMTSGLRADLLAKLFDRIGFDDREDALIASSSIHFPQESGAPRGFNAKRTVDKAREIWLRAAEEHKFA